MYELTCQLQYKQEMSWHAEAEQPLHQHASQPIQLLENPSNWDDEWVRPQAELEKALDTIGPDVQDFVSIRGQPDSLSDSDTDDDGEDGGFSLAIKFRCWQLLKRYEDEHYLTQHALLVQLMENNADLKKSSWTCDTLAFDYEVRAQSVHNLCSLTLTHAVTQVEQLVLSMCLQTCCA
jgi:hypothetical protein